MYISKNKVKLNNDEIINISSKGGILNTRLPLLIKMVGMDDDISGIIYNRNATVSDDFGKVNKQQAIGFYSSTYGDSGSPIISSPQNNTAKLYGLHTGKLCKIKYIGEGLLSPAWTQFQSCLTFLKVITPWENVVKHLELDPDPAHRRNFN